MKTNSVSFYFFHFQQVTRVSTTAGSYAVKIFAAQDILLLRERKMVITLNLLLLNQIRSQCFILAEKKIQWNLRKCAPPFLKRGSFLFTVKPPSPILPLLNNTLDAAITL